MSNFIDQTLLAHILQHESDYWGTIAQVEQHNGWKSYSNPAFAPRIDPNHAGDFRAAEGEAARIVAEVSATFRSRNSPRPRMSIGSRQTILSRRYCGPAFRNGAAQPIISYSMTPPINIVRRR